MKTIKTYESFNHRRYGNPWIAEVIPGTTKPDFSRKVGGYTGAYGKGEAGNPVSYTHLRAPETVCHLGWRGVR